MHSTIVPRHRTRVFVFAPESSPSSVLVPFSFRSSFTHRRIRTRQAPWPSRGRAAEQKKIVRALPANGEFGDQPLLFGLAF